MHVQRARACELKADQRFGVCRQRIESRWVSGNGTQGVTQPTVLDLRPAGAPGARSRFLSQIETDEAIFAAREKKAIC
jgi:hypothetical protein